VGVFKRKTEHCTPMGLLPIELVRARVEATRKDSTADLFNSLLYLSEAFLKTYTAAVVAGLPDEPNRVG